MAYSSSIPQSNQKKRKESEVQDCSHSVQVKGLCAICGLDLLLLKESTTSSLPLSNLASQDSAAGNSVHLQITHDALGVTVSQSEAHRIESLNTHRLLKQKKLSLVLDLDQTLVHAAVDPAIQLWMDDENHPYHHLTKNDVYRFTLPDSPQVFFVKLRPGTLEFLMRMNQLFEMHIYTMGTRSYADQIAKIIDPSSTLFNSRILSRDESGSMTMKSIQRLFPCDQSMVMIVDDRADVWSWAPNLIKVEPYHFFTGVGDINAPKGKERSLPSPSVPISEDPLISETVSETAESNADAPFIFEDSYLGKINQILTNVHRLFYDESQSTQFTASDVRSIASEMKYHVLRGVRIVFSSIIPIGQQSESHDAWKAATSFGAKCDHDISARVTHVVCGKAQTAKANAALTLPGVKVVSYAWLMNCIHHFERLDEEPYLLQPVAEIVNLKEKTLTVEDLDVTFNSDDEAILSGEIKNPQDEIFLLVGQEDWGSMDAEVDEALAESSSDSAEEDWDEFAQDLEQDLTKNGGTPEKDSPLLKRIKKI